MFFHSDLFKQYIGEDQARLVAKLANQIIASQGQVVYGTLFADSECENFTTDQKPADTHVGIIIGVEAMGTLQFSDTPVKSDTPTDEDINRSYEAEIRRLQSENKQLRGK